MSDLVKRGNGYFYSDIWIDGRRIRKSLKTKNRAEARDRLQELIAEAKTNGLTNKKLPSKAPELILFEYNE